MFMKVIAYRSLSMNFFRLGIGLLDSLKRHRNDSEDINITIRGKIALKFAIDFQKNFPVIFELIGSQGPMIFFQVVRI